MLGTHFQQAQAQQIRTRQDEKIQETRALFACSSLPPKASIDASLAHAVYYKDLSLLERAEKRAPLCPYLYYLFTMHSACLNPLQNDSLQWLITQREITCSIAVTSSNAKGYQLSGQFFEIISGLSQCLTPPLPAFTPAIFEEIVRLLAKHIKFQPENIDLLTAVIQDFADARDQTQEALTRDLYQFVLDQQQDRTLLLPPKLVNFLCLHSFVCFRMQAAQLDFSSFSYPTSLTQEELDAGAERKKDLDAQTAAEEEAKRAAPQSAAPLYTYPSSVFSAPLILPTYNQPVYGAAVDERSQLLDRNSPYLAYPAGPDAVQAVPVTPSFYGTTSVTERKTRRNPTLKKRVSFQADNRETETEIVAVDRSRCCC